MAENIFQEIGTPGLEAYSGFIHEAYLSELRWPAVYPLYNKYRRADPEVVIARQVFTAMARGVKLEFSLEENATDDEKRFAEFGDQALDDIEGGQTGLLEAIAENVPFFGWGWWEALPGIRSRGWRAPGDDEWESEYDDGLIGFRRLAFRSPSSFFAWDMEDRSGRLLGMEQMDVPNPVVKIPLNRSLHLTFGDTNNPEGLSPLEALYRLERYKYALELIQGIGFEHAAGYLEVRSTDKLTAEDKALIKAMARAILSAQEANYAAWPSHLTGEIKDIAFQAGTSLLEVIRHYHMLKLQLFAMQWASIATTAGTGAYSAMADSSSTFFLFYNSMMTGFGNQIDAQIGRRLYKLNRDKFPGIVKRPKIKATQVDKRVLLSDIASLINAFAGQLGPEDWLALRKASKILPEKLPDEGEPPEQPTNSDGDEQIEEDAEDTQYQGGAAEMAQRQAYWARYLKSHPEALKQ
jgi:hypothetical protein